MPASVSRCWGRPGWIRACHPVWPRRAARLRLRRPQGPGDPLGRCILARRDAVAAVVDPARRRVRVRAVSSGRVSSAGADSTFRGEEVAVTAVEAAAGGAHRRAPAGSMADAGRPRPATRRREGVCNRGGPSPRAAGWLGPGRGHRKQKKQLRQESRRSHSRSRIGGTHNPVEISRITTTLHRKHVQPQRLSVSRAGSHPPRPQV